MITNHSLTRPTRLASVAVLAMLGTGLGGCGDDDHTVATADVHLDGALADLAAVMPTDPDEVDVGMIRVNDNERSWQRYGLDPLPADASVEDSLAYREDLMRRIGETDEQAPKLLPGLLLPYLGSDGFIEDFRSSIGVDPFHVQAWAEWGEPPDTTIVMVAEVDPSVVEAAARQTDLLGEMTEHTHRGVTYYAWPRHEPNARHERSPVNTLGASRRLAIVGHNTLILTQSDAAMERTIDRHLDHDFQAGESGLDPLVGRFFTGARSGGSIYNAGALDSASYFVVTSEHDESELEEVSRATMVLLTAPGSDPDDLAATIEGVVDDSIAELGLDDEIRDRSRFDVDAQLVSFVVDVDPEGDEGSATRELLGEVASRIAGSWFTPAPG